VFSALLSYTDGTRYKVPNLTLSTLLIFLLVFGFFESRLSFYSFAIALCVFALFVGLILMNRTMILGGGDIKYMLLIALYLNPLVFPLFLIVTGITQTLLLLYFQKIQKRRVAPMVPAMFFSVFISEIAWVLNVYPF
jgi:Flp pilus assembly protein protease CpaA